MSMSKNKRGQFYIIAAIIIIMVLIGFAAVSNKVITRPEENRVYELSKELNLEGEQVINHGVFQQKELTVLLETFTGDYGKYISDESNVYFTYLNTARDKIIIVAYEKVGTGGVSIDLGGGTPPIQITTETRQKPFTSLQAVKDGQAFNVSIGGNYYNFKLNEGENFFFIIRAPRVQEQNAPA